MLKQIKWAFLPDDCDEIRVHQRKELVSKYIDPIAQTVKEARLFLWVMKEKQAQFRMPKCLRVHIVYEFILFPIEFPKLWDILFERIERDRYIMEIDCEIIKQKIPGANITGFALKLVELRRRRLVIENQFEKLFSY